MTRLFRPNAMPLTLAAVAAAMLAFTTAPAQAATFLWTGGGDGKSWDAPANWDDGTLYPGEDPTNDDAKKLEDATQTVVIDSVIPNELANIKANIDADLKITGNADISVSADIRNAGTIVMDGGTLEKTGANGTIGETNVGGLDFTMTGGTLVGTNDLFFAGTTSVVSGTAKVEVGTALRSTPASNTGVGGDFTVATGGQVYDTAGIKAIIQDDSTLTVAGGSFVVDNGGSDLRFRPGGGTFAVEGSSSTVTLNKILLFTNQNSTAADHEFAFKPDAGGTSPIEVLTTPTTTFDLMTLILNDNTSVAWSGSELTLFELPGATLLDDPADQFSNAKEGDTLSFTDSNGTHNLEITYEGGDGNDIVLVPEPATVALLGLGGAVMLTGRKRRNA